jgi:hypothetical protein
MIPSASGLLAIMGIPAPVQKKIEELRSAMDTYFAVSYPHGAEAGNDRTKAH